MSIKERLLKREALGNLRLLRQQNPLLDFASNDYLGLARSKSLYRMVMAEWETLGQLGSTGSRLLTGNYSYTESLETEIASFHGFEEGTLFNCGYMANTGLIATLGEEETYFLYDAKIHASTREGIRLSKGRALPFRHNDLDHLEERLNNLSKKGQCYICVESLYSTEGTLAPLRHICMLAETHGAKVIVDEAHAIGIYGRKGKGFVAQCGLESKVFALVATFGKALGCHGAIVLSGPELKRAMINFAPTFIYTTALPMYALAAIRCSYALFPEMERERRVLFSLMEESFSPSPILALTLKDRERTKQTALKLEELGFAVNHLMSPTVRRREERLKICLHAFNTKEELRRLFKEVAHA